jgi:nodulation protein E
VHETWSRAIRGDGGIRLIDRIDDEFPQARMTGPAAPIAALDLAAEAAPLGGRALASLDPFSKWAAIAAHEAIENAGLIGDPVLVDQSAVLVGCGSGGNASFDAAFQRLYGRRLSKVHPQTISMAMTSAPASQIAILFGMRGPALVISSACASSAHALGEAMWMIRSGRVEVAVAGGSEACLTPGSWIGWKSLGVMATETCRPFSSGRNGLVLGEGAAILVLEERDRALARNATIYAELTGYGASADAAHITAPDQTGIENAIKAAHYDAELDLKTPVLVSSHGTGTILNDRVEASALRAVYGQALDHNIVIATKSAHGHLIGSSAAIELVLGIMALNNQTYPPVLGFLGSDAECDIPLGLTPKTVDYRHLVSNSFAFGGLNGVLIAEVPAR